MRSMAADIITFIFVFVSTLISVAILGIAAGFSPTLYVAQIAIAAKSKRPTAYAVSIMGGVLAAILLLIILFQTFHLDTLLRIIDASIKAITVSVIFNLVVGGIFLMGGVWYLRHQEVPQPKSTKTKQTGGVWRYCDLRASWSRLRSNYYDRHCDFNPDVS